MPPIPLHKWLIGFPVGAIIGHLLCRLCEAIDRQRSGNHEVYPAPFSREDEEHYRYRYGSLNPELN